MTIVRLDLNSLRVDSSLKIPVPASIPVTITGHGSNLLAASYPSEGKKRFIIIDPADGQILKEYPAFAASYWYASEMASDGNNIWVSSRALFDNDTSPIDLSSGLRLKKHHNPIFQPESLTWDGANFWVIDRETRTLAKLQLEGQ
jgi:hypothetical protein